MSSILTWFPCTDLKKFVQSHCNCSWQVSSGFLARVSLCKDKKPPLFCCCCCRLGSPPFDSLWSFWAEIEDSSHLLGPSHHQMLYKFASSAQVGLKLLPVQPREKPSWVTGTDHLMLIALWISKTSDASELWASAASVLELAEQEQRCQI